MEDFTNKVPHFIISLIKKMVKKEKTSPPPLPKKACFR